MWRKGEREAKMNVCGKLHLVLLLGASILLFLFLFSLSLLPSSLTVMHFGWIFVLGRWRISKCACSVIGCQPDYNACEIVRDSEYD